MRVRIALHVQFPLEPRIYSRQQPGQAPGQEEKEVRLRAAGVTPPPFRERSPGRARLLQTTRQDLRPPDQW